MVKGSKDQRVVVAEDDAYFRSLLARTLRERGYSVTEVGDGADLIDSLDFAALGEEWRANFEALVADYHMPGLTGVEVLEGLAVAGAAGRVVLISGFADEEVMEWARRIGAAEVLAKPFPLERLLSAVWLACRNAASIAP